MTTPTDTAIEARESVPRTNPQTTVSKDGKWRTFHKHAGLMQFIPSGAYFARAKVKGKIYRRSLETDVLTTAKLKLPDLLKEFKKPRAAAGTFAEARALYEIDLANDYTLADGSKQYRSARIAALLKSWPGLDDTKLEKISETACRAWARASASAGRRSRTPGP